MRRSECRLLQEVSLLAFLALKSVYLIQRGLLVIPRGRNCNAMDFELMVLVQSNPAPVAYNADELGSRHLLWENFVAMNNN